VLRSPTAVRPPKRSVHASISSSGAGAVTPCSATAST
jgi:hypothetical protein